MDEVEIGHVRAKEKLERVSNRLTVAFSIWALVVAGFGWGILDAQKDITESVDKFRGEFTAYVIASEARLTRLEEIDKRASQERVTNLERIRDLEKRLNDEGKKK